MELLPALIAGTPLGMVVLIGLACKSIRTKKILNIIGGAYTILQIIMLVYVVISLTTAST